VHPARRGLLAAVGVALLALGGAGAWFALERAPAALRPLPDVGFTTIEGRELALSQLRGKVVLVDFWATSCAVCLKEMPVIAGIHQRLEARGLVTIAVAMQYDRPDFVLHYAHSNRLPFAVALDPMGKVAAALGPVRGTPTLLLVDRSGRLVERIEGESDLDALERRIELELERGTGAQAADTYSATSTRLASGSRK
jgi:thiol-disulfide isomerase/thioredoxin